MKRFFLSLIILTCLVSVWAQDKQVVIGDALESEDYPTAIQYATDTLKTNPKYVYALCARGYAFVQTGEYTAAIEDLSQAIRYHKSKSQVPLTFLYCLRGDAYAGLENYKAALADYNTAIRKDKKNSNSYVFRADFYEKQEQYDKAQADYETAYRLNPQRTYYAVQAARCIMMQGNLVKALTHVDMILLYEPKDFSAIRLKSQILLAQQQYKQCIDMFMADYYAVETGTFLQAADHEYAYALEQFRRVLASAEEKDKALWLSFRVELYEHKKQYAEALKDLKTMEALADDSTLTVQLRYRQAQCYMHMYDYAAAVRVLDRLAGQVQELSLAAMRAYALMNIGEYERAMADCSLLIDNGDAEGMMLGYSLRATVKEYRQDYDGALNDYDQALLLNANDKDNLLARGKLLLLHKHDTVRANRDLEQALLLDTIADDNSSRQLVLAYLGRESEALAWQEQILAHHTDEAAYYNAACLYAVLGHKADALSYLKAAVEAGYRNMHHILNDVDLNSLHDTQEFRQIVEDYRHGAVENLFKSIGQ